MHTFLLDTISFGKLIKLNFPSLLNCFNKNKICITHPVLDEIMHHFGQKGREFSKHFTLLPLRDFDYSEYFKLGLDYADASLLEYQIGDEIIISEDHPLIAYATFHRKRAIQLIDFLLFCSKMGVIDNKTLYRCNHELRKMKNITKKKHKEVKQYLAGTNY